MRAVARGRGVRPQPVAQGRAVVLLPRVQPGLQQPLVPRRRVVWARRSGTCRGCRRGSAGARAANRRWRTRTTPAMRGLRRDSEVGAAVRPRGQHDGYFYRRYKLTRRHSPSYGPRRVTGAPSAGLPPQHLDHDHATGATRSSLLSVQPGARSPRDDPASCGRRRTTSRTPAAAGRGRPTRPDAPGRQPAGQPPVGSTTPGARDHLARTGRTSRHAGRRRRERRMGERVVAGRSGFPPPTWTGWAPRSPTSWAPPRPTCCPGAARCRRSRSATWRRTARRSSRVTYDGGVLMGGDRRPPWAT